MIKLPSLRAIDRRERRSNLGCARALVLLLLALAPALAGCSLFESDGDDPAASPTPVPSATVTAEAPAATSTQTPTPAAPTPTPEPREPTQAPDGRTGITDVDGIIETLLNADPHTLVERLGRGILGPLTTRTLDAGGRAVDMPPEDWTALLASSERSLFTVVEADAIEFPSRDYNVVLRVLEPGAEDETFWSFAVRASRPVEVVRSRSVDIRRLTGREFGEFHGGSGSFQLPSVEQLYERYLVLPPPEYLPRQPAAHALSARTGNPAVDCILEALESRAPHTSALIGVVDPGALHRQCQPAPEALVDAPIDVAFAEQWARDVTGGAVGVHAIVDLPEGYQPAAEHLLVLVVRKGQYWWETQGVLEAGGRITGVVDPAWPIEDQSLVLPVGSSTPINYRACLPLPPAEYVVPPPENSLAGLDPARRAGIPLVDAILDALQAGDAAALDALTDYTRVPCIGPGSDFGQGEIGPACTEQEPHGTLVEAIPVVVCHGGWARRDPEQGIDRTWNTEPGLSLYAIPSHSVLILATPNGRSMRWSLSDRGLRSIGWRCGDSHPDRLLGGGDTRFLLPAP